MKDATGGAERPALHEQWVGQRTLPRSSMIRAMLTVLAGLLGMAAASIAYCQEQPSTNERPNILVIMADDLGISDIEPFGSEIETPALNALASEGRLMTSVYVPPLPDIAHAEFLFGKDHHAVVPRAPLGPIKQILPETAKEIVSIAEMLRGRGYRTHMIGTWDAGGGSALNPSAQGFDTSHALLGMADDYFAPDQADPPRRLHYMDNGELVAQPAGYITDFWTDRLIADIVDGQKSGKPFFAYAAYTSPHFPLHAPDSFIRKHHGKYDLGYDATRYARIARQRAAGLFSRTFEPAHPVPESMGYKKWESLTQAERQYEARRMEVYAGMVSNLDWNIGRLVEQLKANGLYDNTLIIFTASSPGAQTVTPHTPIKGVDNSVENMGRRSSWISYSERWAEVSNAPFSRWKAKTTEGGLVVPFIVRMPGQTAAKQPSDAIARLRDLAPTLLDFAGAERSREDAGYTGVSLKPLWEGKTHSAYPADYVFVDEYRDEAYIRKGPWKAVRISDFSVNAYDGADAMVIAYTAALQRGDMVTAEAIRAERPLEWKLYNIEEDRGETRNLAALKPEILHDLLQHFRGYSAEFGIPANPREPN